MILVLKIEQSREEKFCGYGKRSSGVNNGQAYQQSTKTWKGISPIMKKYVLGITLVSRQDDTDNTDTTGRHPEV